MVIVPKHPTLRAKWHLQTVPILSLMYKLAGLAAQLSKTQVDEKGTAAAASSRMNTHSPHLGSWSGKGPSKSQQHAPQKASDRVLDHGHLQASANCAAPCENM